jgi:hypothetical protein
VIDETTRKRVSILRDAKARLLVSDGPRDLPSSSLSPLRLPTVADVLRQARPHATIISMSLKERAALFGGGRRPSATVWFDVALGRFVTSTALAQSFPAWAVAHGGGDVLAPERTRVWTPLDPAFVRAHAATPDAQPGEGDLDGIGVAFPHAMAAARNLPHAWRATPFADEKLLALALDAVDARDPAEPMLLVVSLSANDYVGHVFGPDSWESWDELRRLDAALAGFMRGLDTRLGADGWSLVLTADHGVTTMPEAPPAARPWCKLGAADRWARACGESGRVLPDVLADELKQAAHRALGDGDFVAGVADPYVYLTDAARALPPARRQKLIDALTAALRARDGVVGVYDARTTPPRCAPDDSVDAVVCRAIPSNVPGALYVALRPGWFFDPDYVVGKGTSHGSPYRYDRAVPLVVRAPGRVAAATTVTAPATPADFATTLARLLGVTPPAGARGGRPLCR